MSLTLHSHPLSSYCMKVLIALYENATPFTPHFLDLGDPAARAAHLALWPPGKMPVLRDDARGQTVPESTIIIEYLAEHYPGPVALVPRDPELAREARLHDRFFDCYVMDPMQKIVGDRLRPAGRRDPHGVEAARAQLRRSYDQIDARMATRTWAIGDAFSLADCAAAPSLFYANVVEPFETTHPHAAAYLGRLVARPSFARALREREPYRHLFPTEARA
jgi:glutathione S-transferase